MVVSLIGYRGTGKTTLARLLAQRLGWDWIDADAEIERRSGKSISQIFAEDGEAAFRAIEVEVMADLCGRERLVLAAGGGAPLRSENRRAMREAGPVIWLTASPETILARTNADATTAARRPRLTDKPPLNEIIELLAARTPMYEELADLTIDTEGRSPEELVTRIIERCKLSIRN